MAGRPDGGSDRGSGFFPLLSNRSFLVLWLGQCFSQVADKLVFILLVEIVGGLTPSPTRMSLALAIHASPSVLLGALAGVWVDRLDKRRVMIATNGLRAVFVVALGLWGPADWALAVGLAFMVACCAQPFIPAEGAAIPLVVGKENLLAANSVFATTMIASIIVAFTVGEPLLQLLGTRQGALTIGAAFLVSVAFLCFVHYRQAEQLEETPEPFGVQFRQGLAYIQDRPPIRRTLIQQVAIFGMFAAMSVLAILFAKQELATNFSWFLATTGAGLAIGAWMIGQFGAGWNRDRVITTGFGAVGATLIALALTASTMGAFALAALLGLAASWVAVPLQTRLTEAVDASLRGKVFGVQNMVINIATTLPLALVGFLVEGVGLKPVIASTGLLMLAMAVYSHRVAQARA